MKKSVVNLFGALALVALATISGQAASDTWSGSVNSTWNTANLNWNGGTTGFTGGNDALFTGTPANNVTAATGLTIGAITLDNTFTGSVALTGNNTMSAATTISGGTLSLTTATGLGTSAVTVNSPSTLALNASTAADITYANTVAGAGKIQFLYSATGGHDIFLNNLGSFTGTIELSLGSGQANTGGKARLYGATLSGTSSLIIDSGTQLYMGGGNVTLAGIQVQGTGNSENRGAIRSQSGILAGPISLMANTTIGSEGGTISGNISSGAGGTQTLTLGTVNSTGALTLSGNIGGGTGTIALTKTTAGTTTLSGANTFSGRATINAGTLSVGAINNTGNSGNLGQNSTVDINNATLQYTGAGETSDRVINLAGTTGGATINNQGAGLLKFTSNLTATNGGNKTLTLGGATGTGELAGNITNGPTGETALLKTGANTWTLSAATNTFTGQLRINGGTLVWSTAGALAPAAGAFQPLDISAGGALTVNGPLRYSGTSVGTGGYLNVGNNAAGGFGTITINSGGSLTFTNQAGNPNSAVGQQGTGGASKLIVNGGTFNWDGTGGLLVGNSGGSGTILITNGGVATILKGTGSPEEGLIMLGRDSNTSVGQVDLATGTLATSRVFVRDGSSAAGSGVANFNFNGGKLQALANQTDWLQSSTSGNNLALSTVTIMDGGAKIDANGFSVAINNTLTHGGVAATDGGVTKLGSGTLTLGGTGHTYNGLTIVSNGVLAVAGSLPSGSAVTVAGGTLTVSGSVGGTVTVQPGGAVGASSGTFSSLVTLNAGNSAINLQDGSATTTTFANGLTLNNGNVLAFDLGAASDQISVPGTFTHNGTATINLAAVSGISTTTYTLISDAANDITVTNGFIIGTVPGGYAATLGVSGGSLTVTLTQSAPGAAYWKGDVDNKWNTLTGGINSNWATDSTGATDTGAVPGTPTAVTFAATGAANFNTVLGADFTINNLTLSTANNVTIGGTTNTLTLIGGLLNDTTALNNTLSVSNVVLSSPQTWQNNSANPLTVSSKISGASDLTFGGTGTIVLVNTNNNFAGSTISGGTLQLGDGSASNGAVAGGITNNSVVTFANPAAQSFADAISGSGQLVKTAAGTLTFPADNTYGGSTTISNGSLVIVTANGASSGTVDVKSGASLVCQPTTTTTYANTVTGAGLVKILFGNEGLGYNNGGDWFTHLDNLSGFTGTIQLSATTVTNVNKWDASTATVSGASALIVDSGAQLYMNGSSLTFSTIQINGSGNYQNRGAVRAGAGTLTGAISLLGDTTFGTEGGTIAGTIASGAAGTQILTLGGTADLGGNITLSADIGGGTGAIALNKINTGTTTLSGVNTFTGPTTNSAGTLILANGSALQNSTLTLSAGTLVFDSSVSSNAFVFGGLAGTANITFANNASSAIALTVGNSGTTTTFSGALNDNGAGSSLTKVGNGSLTLSGVISYNGSTAVKGGTLGISTLLTNATPGIAVDDGATLAITAVGTNQMVPATYTLGSSAGPVTNNFAGLSSTTIAPVNAGTLTLAGQTTVNINGGSFVVGNVYPLISYASIGGAGGFKVGSLPRGLVATIVTNGGNAIALNVTSYTPVKDVWTGSVNTNWDIVTTANWQTNGVAGVYFDGDATRFDDTATATNVFVTIVVSPSSVIVSNVTKTFTFAGSAISGASGLTKQGAGMLVLGQANTYTGNTVVSNGTLKVTTANAIPTGSGKGDVVTVGAGVLDVNATSITVNGLSGNGTVDTVAGGNPTLTVGNNGASSTFSGILQNSSGSLALTKTGNGTLTLSGTTNTLTGQLQVNGGTLNWNTVGALAPSAANFLPLNVQSGGALIVNGSLKYSSGTAGVNGYLQVGNSGAGNIGTITINSGGSLTFANETGNPNSVVGQFGTGGTSSLNVNGGAFNWDGTSGLFIGNAGGSGELLITNGGTATILKGTGTSDEGYLAFGRDGASSSGTLYLANGTLATDRIICQGLAPANGTGYVFFDGGTLKALGNQTDWLQSVVNGNAQPPSAVTINAGAAVIDANGFSVAIGNALTSGASPDGGLVLIDSSVAKNGVLILGGASTYNGATVVSNGTLVVNGSTSTGDTTVKGGTLGGTGTIGGLLTVNSGATLAPGSGGIGALTVSGNLTLNAGSTNAFEVDGTTPANDAVAAGASVTYGGVLKIVPTGTFSSGQTFTLFSGAGAASASNFSSIAGSPGSGLGFTFTNGVLSVVTTGPSGPGHITNSISGSTLTMTWPAGQGWVLVGQTNTLALGLNTNAAAWNPVPGGVDGSISITINPANPTVFYRLRNP